jgi:hypothetical protein
MAAESIVFAVEQEKAELPGTSVYVNVMQKGESLDVL